MLKFQSVLICVKIYIKYFPLVLLFSSITSVNHYDKLEKTENLFKQ